MVVECPAYVVLPSLAARLSDVVQKGSPSEPQVVGMLADVVEHLERVVEVVLVGASVAHLNALKRNKFGEDDGKQSAAVKLNKAFRRDRREHNLVKLVDYALF